MREGYHPDAAGPILLGIKIGRRAGGREYKYNCNERQKHVG